MSRVTDIRYVGYAVRDIEAERTFYGKWGLEEVAESDGLLYFAASGHYEPFVVRLRQADQQRIDVVAFAADSRADVDALFSRVKEAGSKIISEPADLAGYGGGYGFRFFSPDGLPFEISSDVARQAGPPALRADIPVSISHIVLHSANHKAMVAFFVDVLGFRVSDWLGDVMGFLRCNEWHHRIAVLPGPPCLNHVAYDMHSLDDMMQGVSRLKGLDVNIQWGPGRHTAGNNTFSYFTTPNGFAVEYTAELERVDETTWKPTVHPRSAQVVDKWGIGVGGPEAMPHPEPDAGLFLVPQV